MVKSSTGSLAATLPGSNIIFALGHRGRRCAQPPANGYDPSGVVPKRKHPGCSAATGVLAFDVARNVARLQIGEFRRFAVPLRSATAAADGGVVKAQAAGAAGFHALAHTVAAGLDHGAAGLVTAGAGDAHAVLRGFALADQFCANQAAV